MLLHSEATTASVMVFGSRNRVACTVFPVDHDRDLPSGVKWGRRHRLVPGQWVDRAAILASFGVVRDPQRRQVPRREPRVGGCRPELIDDLRWVDGETLFD